MTRGNERDLAAKHTGADDLVAIRRERNELADVLRAAIVLAVERAKQLLHVPAFGPARRLHTRRAAEGRHLDPRVVGEHPAIGRPKDTPVAGLDASIVHVRRAVLRREVGVCEELELPVWK